MKKTTWPSSQLKSKLRLTSATTRHPRQFSGRRPHGPHGGRVRLRPARPVTAGVGPRGREQLCEVCGPGAGPRAPAASRVRTSGVPELRGHTSSSAKPLPVPGAEREEACVRGIYGLMSMPPRPWPTGRDLRNRTVSTPWPVPCPVPRVGHPGWGKQRNVHGQVPCPGHCPLPHWTLALPGPPSKQAV